MITRPYETLTEAEWTQVDKIHDLMDDGELEDARRALDERVPTLGICLGMQLFSASSEEGKLAGLAWLPGRTVRFREPAGRRGGIADTAAGS